MVLTKKNTLLIIIFFLLYLYLYKKGAIIRIIIIMSVGYNSYIKNKINNAVSFIEENILNPISINDVTSSVFCSQYHFQRLFKQFTNFSIKKYIRKRRLSLAAYNLITYNKNIIDIAYEYYFEYEQSFIRAFKHEFGVTPGRFRKDEIDIVVTDRFYFNNMRIKPRLLLHHKSRYIGLKKELSSEKNNTFRIKSDFIKNYTSRIKNQNKLLYCFLTQENSGLIFIPSYKIDNLTNCP